LRPLAWLLVRGWWPLQLNATDLAAAADLQERTAPRGLQGRAGGLDETSPWAPTRPLASQGEADACDQKAGSTGRARAGARHDRAPRQRGMQLRGRATAPTGRPPLRGWGPRRDQLAQDAPAAPVSLAVLETVRTAPSKPLMAAKVKDGTPVFTDAYPIAHCTQVDEEHRTGNQGAGASARRDPDGTCVHCHPLDGMWSGLRHCWDRFKGRSQRVLPLRVARDAFLHNDKHLSWGQTFAAPLQCIFSTTGDSLRWMAHQHRRMPLTLCYR
jgi:hypothetical protein